MFYRRLDSAHGQRGAALVLALLVFALAAALMVGLQRDFQLLLQRASNSGNAEQVWSYLLGAEALASTALRLDADNDAQSPDPIDDLNELWAQPATPYLLDEGGWLSGQLQDLQGRINVNALADQRAADDGSGPRFSDEQKLMIRLLQALEEVPLSQLEAIAITEAIADFIDSDEQRRIDGAENETYRTAPLPYLAANRPMASVSELRAVQGITPEIYSALAPHVTVWPVNDAAVNWRTATPVVLRALMPDERLEPMPPAEALRLLELRTQGAFRSVDDFLADPLFADQGTAGLRDLLSDRSSWFLLTAEVEIADRMSRLYSVLNRNGRSIAVAYRSNGEP